MASVMAALAGCSEAAPDVPIPEPPPMLSLPAEYAFGDAIGAADAAAIGHVIDMLKPRYGQPEVTRYTAPSGTDFSQIETYYDTRARATGWEPIAALSLNAPAGERAVGYRRDGAAFAVLWLAPRPGSPITSVNVIRFGD